MRNNDGYQGGSTLPQHLRRNGGRDDGNKQNSDLEKIKQELGRFCEIFLPQDAPHPILAPTVREALFGWMLEITSAEELAELKVEPRRSALFYGPPGTGKTTAARVIAARLGLPLALVRSERLIDRYLGSTGQNIGALLDAMKKTEGKVLVFFDEVDAIGSKRQQDSGASQERANSLNVLLAGIEQFKGIYLAATNRQAHLDDALWRRFGMQISIDLPGFAERFAIVRMYADPLFPPDDDADLLADLTAGASPALLKNLIEGVKRAHVMWPKIHQDREATAVDLFRSVVLSVNPAPEYEKPPLWASESAVEQLSTMQWPWPLREDAA